MHVLSAARYLVDISGGRLTHLALQKIIYIAHMFHLGRHEAPLISGQFEAWEYGPVHPVLYHNVKVFGAEPVPFIDYPIDIQEEVARSLIEEAYEALGGRSGAQLITITHWRDGAWAKNYLPGANNPIPDGDILEEYRKRAGAHEKGTKKNSE